MDKHTLIELLKKDVVPALGCTEPVCVALCTAWAGKQLEDEIIGIDVTVNTGIYKNGMSAGIPNCSEVGLNYAAAIGANLKNPEKQLEILTDVTPSILTKASQLVRTGSVQVRLAPDQSGLYVKCVLHTAKDSAVCIIQDAHTNIVYLARNGEILFEKHSQSQDGPGNDIVDTLKEMKLSEIRTLVDTMEANELEFLLDGVEMNEALAAYSETTPTGVGIADTLRKELGSPLFSNDLLNRILLKVSSAAESRLDGCPLPTMSSSGAGTKGLVVILPVSETAKAIHAEKEKTLRALALAHLVNRYINAHIGKLSPMCSCVMASSTAAAAAITYLLGGSDQQIGYAIRNMSGTVTGMICDGGKVGCALKVSTGSTAAFLSAITAVNNAALRTSDGICAESPEDCIQNIARIGIHGMAQTDQEILRIMTRKK